MIIDLSNFKPSDYAAWWGAVIATLALVWNIVVSIRSGPRLHVTVSKNMEFIPPPPDREDKKYIIVSAINRGTAPTTITHFLGYAADSWWSRFFTSKRKHFIVTGYPESSPIPQKIDPGDEWRGIADQAAILDDEEYKYVYLGVAHNQSQRTIYKRVAKNA